jgi:hypothetical protein
MGGGSGDSHGAHGGGKAASAYPDRFPNSCEFRIPGKTSIFTSTCPMKISSSSFQIGVRTK